MIKKTLLREEEQFAKTLEHGLRLLQEAIPKIVNKMSTLLLMAARPTNAWNEYLQTLYTEGQVANFKVPPL